MADHPADDPIARYFWERHASPRSVWTLVATYPLLVLAVYRRGQRLLVATLLFALVNMFGHDPPADDSAWATRVVLGERVWLDRGLASSPGDLLCVTVTAPVYLFTLRAAVRQQPLKTAVGTSCSLVVMLLFFARLERLYDEHGPLSDGTGPS